MFAAIPLIQKIVGGVALGLILLLTLAWQIEKRSADKWEARAVKLAAEMQSISTKRDEQKRETSVNISKAERGRKGAEVIARRIEAAPVEPNCKTPESILAADL